MLFRRCRGLLGTTLIWGLVWVPLGAVGSVAVALRARWSITPDLLLRGAVAGSIWGGIAGTLFGSGLMLAEQRNSLAALSERRTVAWGALAALWPFILTGLYDLAHGSFGGAVFWVGSGIAATLGAISGVATLAFARLTDPPSPPTLPPALPPGTTGPPDFHYPDPAGDTPLGEHPDDPVE